MAFCTSLPHMTLSEAFSRVYTAISFEDTIIRKFTVVMCKNYVQYLTCRLVRTICPATDGRSQVKTKTRSYTAGICIVFLNSVNIIFKT